MATHPINLAFRFLLELSLLAAAGYWGWHQSQGVVPFLLALLVPLAAAALWGIFRVPADSPGGRAPVAVPGPVRLLLELGLFGFAVWALFDAGAETPGWILGAAVLLHYVVSYQRLIWLLRRA